MIPQQPGSHKKTEIPESLLGELQSEVSAEASPLLDFIVRHGQNIMSVFIVCAVIIGAIGGYRWYQQSSVEKIHTAIVDIIMTKKGHDAVVALEALAADAPEKARTAVLLELANAAMAAEDYAKAAFAFDAIYKAEPQSVMGFMAALNYADTLTRLGKHAESVTLLDSILAQTPAVMQDVVRDRVAESAWRAGQPEKAVAAYEAILAKKPGAEADYYRARVQAIKDKSQKK